jgi:hypothetical protein
MSCPDSRDSHIDQQQSSQHEVDPPSISTNDEMDFPETCEKVEVGWI